MYRHKVQYYETDKMGIVHHSNYIRFMEEARVDFLNKIGCDFSELEDHGLFSPVVAINKCRFHKPAKFGDEIMIDASIVQYTGVRLVVGYKMFVNDTLIFEGESEHCFVSKDGRVLRLSENNFSVLDSAIKNSISK